MAEMVSLFPSPVRKKIRTFTNFDECIVCQTASNDVLNSVTEDSFDSITKLIRSMNDSSSNRLKSDIESKELFFSNKPKWHRSCRSKYFRRSKTAQESAIDANSTSTSRFTRQSVPQFDYTHMCVICGAANLGGKHRRDQLRKVETESIQDRLYSKAVELGDFTLLVRIQGGDEKPIDMVAAGVMYHTFCYDGLRARRAYVKVERDVYTVAFEDLLGDIVGPLEKGKLFHMSTLRDMYRVHMLNVGLDSNRSKQYRTACLKRRLETHFGENILFVPQGGNESELVCSAQLSAADLLKAWQILKTDVEEHYVRIDEVNSENDDDFSSRSDNSETKMAFKVAQKIKFEMREMQKNTKEDGASSWKVTHEQALSTVPVSLYNLLAFVLSDSASFDKTDEDGRVILDCTEDANKTRPVVNTHEKVLNLAQDIIFTATSMRTPQHVGLAVYVYHKTRSRDLITVLNRLGLCISYVDLQRLLTSVACQITDQAADDGTFIPANILSGHFTQFAIDNLDFSECTLDGSSMHVTSMVMYQPAVQTTIQGGSIGTIPSNIVRRTSLFGTAGDMGLKSVTKTRTLKRNLRPGENLRIDWLLQQKSPTLPNLNLCWAMSRLCPTKLLEVEIDCPGWKVFNAAISTNVTPVTSIGYCPFLPQSPTDPNVVREALHICIRSSRKLGMQHTVVTQDEAVYEISYTLRHQNPGEYSDVVLRLGGFHLLMNFLGAIGKLMSGTGLKELFVTGKLLMEGTANKIMSGKGYYQAINAHMRVYEATMSLRWSAFENWCLSREMNLDVMSEVSGLVDHVGNVLQDDCELARAAVRQFDQKVEQIKTLLCQFDQSRHDYLTHQLWLGYLDMLDTALLFIHAEREGVWSEHISATASMAEVIVAADHTKYTKAVVSYLEEMRKLPETAPEVQTEFENGRFAVKRSPGKFNMIWTDMALECSQNCDAKGRSGQAGLKGVTMKGCTQEKWFLTLPFTAAVSADIKSMVHLHDENEAHHEANVATKNRELVSRERLIQTFVDGEIINPFTCTTKAMINISDGQVATAEVSRDLLGARHRGREALEQYLATGIVTKLKLKRFVDIQQSSKRDKPKQIKKQLVDEMSVLKRVLLERERGVKDTHMQDLLQHELHSYPPSIAEMDDATKVVKLRSGNKAMLLNIMKTSIAVQEWPVTMSDGNHSVGVIVDVMGLVRTQKPLDTEVSEKYAERLLLSAVQITQCEEMHLVADRYDGIHGVQDATGNSVSLKDASGCRDRRMESTREYEVNSGQVIKHWDDIVKSSKSKANLLRCLYESWSHCSDHLPDGLTLTLAGGFENREHVVTLRQPNSFVRSEFNLDHDHDLLASTHEEADTRVFLHTAACVHRGCTRVVIIASDTDIAVIAVYLFQRLADAGLAELYIKTKDYYIPIHDVVRSFSIHETQMLPLLHALSGCDTTSFFFGKGKRSFIKAASKRPADLADVCTKLEKQTTLTEELRDRIVTVATELLTTVYHTNEFSNLCTLRGHLYARKPDIKGLPPTDDAFRQHVLRAILQTCIWVKAMQPTPSIPDIFQSGWVSLPAGVRPLLMLRSSMPANLLGNLFCNCKQMCSRNCPCKKKNVACDITCSCKGERATCLRAQLANPDDASEL